MSARVLFKGSTVAHCLTRDPGFEPHRGHRVVSLCKTHLPIFGLFLSGHLTQVLLYRLIIQEKVGNCSMVFEFFLCK